MAALGATLLEGIDESVGRIRLQRLAKVVERFRPRSRGEIILDLVGHLIIVLGDRTLGDLIHVIPVELARAALNLHGIALGLVRTAGERV